MKMAKLTFEDRIELAKTKIKEKPQQALSQIGRLMVVEIRKNTPVGPRTTRFKSKLSKKDGKYKWTPYDTGRETPRTTAKKGKNQIIKPGKLKRSIGFWYRKKVGDLQIGSKVFYSRLVIKGTSKMKKNDFIWDSMEPRIPQIQDIILKSLKELERENNGNQNNRHFR